MLNFGPVLPTARASLFAACSCVPVWFRASLTCTGPKSANPPARPRPPPAPCRGPRRSPPCTCTRGARGKARPPNTGPPPPRAQSGHWSTFAPLKHVQAWVTSSPGDGEHVSRMCVGPGRAWPHALGSRAGGQRARIQAYPKTAALLPEAVKRA
jgi:hypothetical protein